MQHVMWKKQLVLKPSNKCKGVKVQHLPVVEEQSSKTTQYSAKYKNLKTKLKDRI